MPSLTQASMARNIMFWDRDTLGGLEQVLCFQASKTRLYMVSFFRDIAFHFSNENWSTKKIWICYKHDDMAKTFAYLICKILSIIVFFIYTITLDYYKQARVIPDNCYGHHGRCPCKNILSGVKFSRLNTKTAYILLFRDIFLVFWCVSSLFFGCNILNLKMLPV